MSHLILGAAGYLGLNLVDALAELGIAPRCGRRPKTNVIPLRRRGLELANADLDNPDELERAMRPARVVYHLAGHYPRLSVDRAAAIATGTRQLRHVLRAAERARVERLIYVSSTATVAPSRDDRPADERDVFDAPPGFGVYHDLKWHMEDIARREAGCEVLIACPGACLGPFDYRVGTTALLAATAQGLQPPHPDGVVNLVDVRDVAHGLVALGQKNNAPNRVLLTGHNHRLHDFLGEISQRYGVAAPAEALSGEAAIALADAEEHRVAGTRERPRLSREIADLVVHGGAINAQLAERELGLKWTPLNDTLDAFDDWARRMRIIPSPNTDIMEQIK